MASDPLGDTVASTETVGSLATTALPEPGYDLGELLGRGGMGEVVLATDRRIGRRVAIKRLRTAQPDAAMVARFLREAQIQARLDHPAIVPVHEVGTDPQGRPYFAMKQLAGTTLQAQLANRTETTQRLLRAIIEVCFAIELAHARGVVHRDLKPANIMLGHYGEVYVLDWGVARVLGEAESDAIAPLGNAGTLAGALIGTPGYMAPEQARGEPVGTAADSYSLGCILYEILAGAALHPIHDALASTLERPTPREVAPDVAPELDAICIAALASDPAARPTARELANRLERYLDGDRDLERRRMLAAEHYAEARAAYVANDRATAMRAASRALALDPKANEAAQLVTKLVLDPPVELPSALRAHLAAVEHGLALRQTRSVGRAYATFILLIPILLWIGVTDWLVVGAVFGLTAALVALTLLTNATDGRIMWPALLLNTALTLAIARVSGPFVIVPGMFAIQLLSYMAYPRPQPPAIPIAVVVGSFVGVIAIEAVGLVTPTWSIEGSALVTQSRALAFDAVTAPVFLVLANVLLLLVAGWFGREMSLQRRDAIHRAERQAWHLKQLLP